MYAKLNQNGTLSSCSKPREGFTALSNFQTKSDGSYYKFYKTDGTGDTVKEELEAKKEANTSIYAKLDLIDLKSIRAIRENNQEKMTALENEATALRAELNVINEGA